MRAVDRDRTGVASLEGWGSTIELHPRDEDIIPCLVRITPMRSSWFQSSSERAAVTL